MSKEIIKARADDKKAAVQQLAATQKFEAAVDLTAKDCRAQAEANGAPTITDQVESSWTKILSVIKGSVAIGKSSVQVPAGPTNHPEVRDQIIKRLDRAGFKHELNGGFGYIYW